jgi:hypothetical protein
LEQNKILNKCLQGGCSKEDYQRLNEIAKEISEKRKEAVSETGEAGKAINEILIEGLQKGVKACPR